MNFLENKKNYFAGLGLMLVIIAMTMVGCQKEYQETIDLPENEMRFKIEEDALDKIVFEIPEDKNIDKSKLEKLLNGMLINDIPNYTEYFNIFKSLTSKEYQIFSKNFILIEKAKLLGLGYTEQIAQDLVDQSHYNRIELNKLSVDAFAKPHCGLNPSEYEFVENKFEGNDVELKSSCTAPSYTYATTVQLTSPTIWSSNCENYYTIKPCTQSDCDKEYSFNATTGSKIRATSVATQAYLELKGDNFSRRAGNSKTYVLLGWGNSLTASYIKSTLSLHGNSGVVTNSNCGGGGGCSKVASSGILSNSSMQGISLFVATELAQSEIIQLYIRNSSELEQIFNSNDAQYQNVQQALASFLAINKGLVESSFNSNTPTTIGNENIMATKNLLNQLHQVSTSTKLKNAIVQINNNIDKMQGKELKTAVKEINNIVID